MKCFNSVEDVVAELCRDERPEEKSLAELRSYTDIVDTHHFLTEVFRHNGYDKAFILLA